MGELGVALKTDLRGRMMRECPPAAFIPNGAQERFIREVGMGEYGRAGFFAGNGVGKTAAGAMILSLAIYGKASKCPWFSDSPLFQNWPYLKDARIVANPKLLKETGAIHKALDKWLIRGTYEREKGHEEYFSIYRFPAYGWTIEIVSNEKGIEAHQGGNLGIVWTDEPYPQSLAGETAARLREGGIWVMTLSPTEGSEWQADEWEGTSLSETSTAGKWQMFRADEKGPKEWFFVVAEDEANCVDHGERGRLKHMNIAAARDLREKTDPMNVKACRYGLPSFSSGRVYPDWGDVNEIDWSPEKVEWEIANALKPKVIAPVICVSVDTHPVRPWAITYSAIYPDKIVIFREWPNQDFAPFHRIDTMVKSNAEYILIMRDLEKRLKVYQRYGDKRSMFGSAQDRIHSVAQELRSLSDGNINFLPGFGNEGDNRHLVTSAIKPQITFTDQGEIVKMPRLYAHRGCKNLCFSMRRWSLKERKGLALEANERYDTKAQQRHKCFPNTLEFLLSRNPRWMAAEDWGLAERDEDEDEDEATGTYGRQLRRTGYHRN